jgi:hypothetical protein
MTLLRYSHHGTGYSDGGEKSATTVVKLAGAKKSWTNRNNKRASLTTIPGVTTTATMTLHRHATKPFQHPPSNLHRNNYRWTRSPHEPSFIQATTEMIMQPQQQQQHARTSVWRRPKNHDNAELQPAAVVLLDTPINNSSMVQPNDSLVTEPNNNISNNNKPKVATTLAKPSTTVDSEHETHESTASVNDTGKNNAHSYESTTGKGEDHTTLTTTTTTTPAAATQERLGSITESQDTAHVSQDESPLSSISLQMKKRGAHQLVRRNRSNVANQHVDDASDKVKSTGAALSNAGDSALRKLGPNKLVLSNPPTKAPPATLAKRIRPTAASKRKLICSTLTQGRKLPRPSRRGDMQPAAKRVKLSETSVSASTSDESNLAGNAVVVDAWSTATNGDKRMTDFAYRETSNGRSRSQQQDHHQHQHAHRRRNMGLVRVPPNPSMTPICPTFLQGLACTDETCPKRHDVPKEAATPICSFFQRQGQCLKGPDCPFRHVKVNPRAVVCPSFSLLGFCETEDCLMKHVRTKFHHHKSLSATANLKTME